MRRIRGAFAAVVAAAMCACVKPVFTQAVRDRYGLSARDLQRIQFFTSEDITLRREVVVQSRKIAGNGLAVGDDVQIHEVVVPSGTPGVAVRVEGRFVLVSFARQRVDSALWFALEKSEEGAPPDGRKYRLVELENAAMEEGPFEPKWSKGFLVTWKGEKYRIVNGRDAHLLYEINEQSDRARTSESAPGWRLREGAPRPAANPEGPAPSEDAGPHGEPAAPP